MKFNWNKHPLTKIAVIHVWKFFFLNLNEQLIYEIVSVRSQIGMQNANLRIKWISCINSFSKIIASYFPAQKSWILFLFIRYLLSLFLLNYLPYKPVVLCWQSMYIFTRDTPLFSPSLNFLREMFPTKTSIVFVLFIH